ncbi:MAG: hypothetical protein WC967_13465 [Balneolaceae bacterium]
MDLKAQIRITSKFTGKSTFEFWKDLQTGDLITLKTPFEWPEGNRGHTYAQRVTLYNLRNGLSFRDSLRGIVNRLDKTTWEEVE